MNHDDIDAAIAAAAPIGDAQVTTLPLDGPKASLMEEIMSTPLMEIVDPETQPGRPTGRRRLAAIVAIAAVLAAVVVVQPFRNRGTAWAAEVLEVAESAPRLLVGGDWQVTRADEFAADLGEMTFSDGDRGLDLHWRSGADYDGYIIDREASADLVQDVEVAGHEATLFRYTGTTDFTTLWRQGDHTLEVRGVFPALDDYLAVLGSLHEVDVDTWLTAMPASVVRPDDVSVVVDDMLAGIPLPDGFDAVALADGASVRDRYQLGARVAGGVACAWFAQWVDAMGTGDEAIAQEAVDALATSTDWPILLEMAADGAYPQVLREYAAGMAGDGTVMGGRQLTVAETYPDALGCDDR